MVNPALSLLMKHLVIGLPKKVPDFFAFNWSPHGSLVSIGHEGSTFTGRTERSLITESDQKLT